MRPAGCPSQAGPARALPPRRSRTSARRARTTGVGHLTVVVRQLAVRPLGTAVAVARVDLPAAERVHRRAESVRLQIARKQIAPTAAIAPRVPRTPSHDVAVTVVAPTTVRATPRERAPAPSDSSEARQQARGDVAIGLSLSLIHISE